MSTQTISPGLLKPWGPWGDFNNTSSVVQLLMSRMQTATLVQVVSCTNDGGLSPFGLVDVIPLVNQVDGSNPPNPTPHITIHGLPYARIQGGTNAIILDPQPGDIGMAVFASRDISLVVRNQEQSNPGSARQFDYADGMYLGGMLNGTPQQYVQFSAAGIQVVSPTQITLTAPTVNIKGALVITDGDATMSGKLSVTGDVKAATISLMNHVHTSEAPGSPTSPPTP